MLLKLISGRRNGETHCEATQRWASENTTDGINHLIRLAFYLSCKMTRLTILIVMLGIPEIICYVITFYNIAKYTNQTAVSGILSPDVIRKRKQRNLLNITMTFWVWLAQLVTNIIYLILLFVFYGKIRFFHNLLVVLTIGLNFNILPLFYITIADGDFRTSLLTKDYLGFLKLFM